MYSEQDILNMFKSLLAQAQHVNDLPNADVMFIIRDKLMAELGLMDTEASNLAMAINYNITDTAREMEVFEDCVSTFADCVIAAVRLVQKTFPAATMSGIIAFVSSMTLTMEF